MEKIVRCKACGNDMAKSANSCPNCGAKNKKPIYKKWWFWIAVGILVIVIAASSGGDKTDTDSASSTNETTNTETITFESVDLDTMLESLKNNAMKAEKEYKNKHIEVTGKIKNFDSDGKYISIEPTNADVWNFDSAMCYIKNDTQKNVLIEKNVGDVVTIKGKVKSIGEVLGYQIDIAEVQ